MTMPANNLLAQLEGAEGGSRELDLAIGVAVGHWHEGADSRGPYRLLPDGGVAFAGNATNSLVMIPHYTQSLDAALALAERGGWRLRTLDHSIPNQPSVMLEGPVKHYPAEGDYPAHDGPAYQCGRGKTRPLATCIAILRALEENQP